MLQELQALVWFLYLHYDYMYIYSLLIGPLEKLETTSTSTASHLLIPVSLILGSQQKTHFFLHPKLEKGNIQEHTEICYAAMIILPPMQTTSQGFL